MFIAQLAIEITNGFTRRLSILY